MHVKILGPGCANCGTLEKNTHEALAALGLDPEVTKVTDYAEIAAYGVMRTPALVVDDKVLLSGRVPKAGEIKDLLTQHGSAAPAR